VRKTPKRTHYYATHTATAGLSDRAKDAANADIYTAQIGS